ncbi:MAG: pilus assembly PilX family protein [Granulosicoccaceae bacterium]
MKNYKLGNHRKQSGITLVIGLIMLVVITLIAISVSNMVTVDLRIARNQQTSLSAKAAAESGIDSLINDPAQLAILAPFSFVNNPIETLPVGTPHTVNGPSGSTWQALVTVKRMGDPLPCPKATLPINTSSIDSTSIAKCVYFEITSIGRSDANLHVNSSTQTLTRGFYRKVGGFVSG